MSRHDQPRCRGFGERLGACSNPPGKRKVHAVVVPTLCSPCEAAHQRLQDELRGRPQGRLLSIETVALDTGMRRWLRRSP